MGDICQFLLLCLLPCTDCCSRTSSGSGDHRKSKHCPSPNNCWWALWYWCTTTDASSSCWHGMPRQTGWEPFSPTVFESGQERTISLALDPEFSGTQVCSDRERGSCSIFFGVKKFRNYLIGVSLKYCLTINHWKVCFERVAIFRASFQSYLTLGINFISVWLPILINQGRKSNMLTFWVVSLFRNFPRLL